MNKFEELTLRNLFNQEKNNNLEHIKVLNNLKNKINQRKTISQVKNINLQSPEELSKYEEQNSQKRR